MHGRLREPLARALADGRIRPDELSAVVLAGGAIRMPGIRRLAAWWSFLLALSLSPRSSGGDMISRDGRCAGSARPIPTGWLLHDSPPANRTLLASDKRNRQCHSRHDGRSAYACGARSEIHRETTTQPKHACSA